MFVLACALKTLDLDELVAYTQAMIAARTRSSIWVWAHVADKHCIGGIGNRTTPIVVPLLVALGVCIPKTSSRAITSPAGTADTMGVLAGGGAAADSSDRAWCKRRGLHRLGWSVRARTRR